MDSLVTGLYPAQPSGGGSKRGCEVLFVEVGHCSRYGQLRLHLGLRPPRGLSQIWSLTDHFHCPRASLGRFCLARNATSANSGAIPLPSAKITSLSRRVPPAGSAIPSTLRCSACSSPLDSAGPGGRSFLPRSSSSYLAQKFAFEPKIACLNRTFRMPSALGALAPAPIFRSSVEQAPAVEILSKNPAGYRSIVLANPVSPLVR